LERQAADGDLSALNLERQAADGDPFALNPSASGFVCLGIAGRGPTALRGEAAGGAVWLGRVRVM
jgi:hypothetical protein